MANKKIDAKTGKVSLQNLQGSLNGLLIGILVAFVACGARASPTQAEKTMKRVEFVQYDLLRTSPDDGAPFVPWRMSPGAPTPIREEMLSRQGDWDEMRLHYRFKYPSSATPGIDATSLFEGTVSGFRKTAR